MDALNLKSLDLSNLKTIFPEIDPTQKDGSRELATDQKHVRTVAAHITVDATQVNFAVEHVGRLPNPGEAFHMIVGGRYSLWDCGKAIMALAAPAKIAWFGIATLSFSRKNIEEIKNAMDAGAIQKLDFMFSVYFRSHEKQELCDFTTVLSDRGARVLCMRSHAKLLLIETTDGRAFTVESSANLRSSGNVEQMTIVHDAALLTFHKHWLNSLFAEDTR